MLVDTWERGNTPDGSGLEIFGALKNTGKDTATDITVTVKVLDEAGKLLSLTIQTQVIL